MGDGEGRQRADLAAAGLLIVFATLCVHGMLSKSATFDEMVYVASGYSYLETGDFRMHREAPPLIPTLSGIALEALGAFVPIGFSTDGPDWEEAREYAFARHFFHEDNSRGFLMLTAARVPIVLLGVLLGLGIYRFGKLLFGAPGGLLALAIFSLDPNMIAHSRIVSADLGLALFFLLSHYFLYAALTSLSVRPVILMSLSVALVLSVKFSGLLVLPSLAFLALVTWLRPPTAILDSLSASAYRQRLLRLSLLGLLLSFAATFLLLSILYHGLDAFSRYYEGIKLIYWNKLPGYRFYLLGEFREKAWPYYYQIAFLLKTPVPTLILGLLAAALWRRPAGGVHKALFLIVPFLLVQLVGTQDTANLGLRRVLACYPLLFLAVGSLAAWSRTAGPRRVPRALLLRGLLVALAVSAVMIHPHQLSFFNLIAGGPESGYRHLADSDIDWGQDLPALATLAEAGRWGEIGLSYFGTDVPESYGIRWRPIREEEWLRPGPGVYAVSVRNLIYNKLAAEKLGRPEMDWLARHAPSARAGYSIYVYDFRGTPENER